MALSVSLVVATTSGYASAEKAVRQFVENFLGTDDAKIRNDGEAGGLPEAVLDDVRRDPAVFKAFGRLSGDRPVRVPGQEAVPETFNLLGVDPASDGYLARMPVDAGRRPRTADERVAMVDFGARDALGVELGGEIEIVGPDGPTTLRVVGFVYKPKILTAFGMRTVYVPLETLQQIVGDQTLGTIVVEYAVGADGDRFVERWRSRLGEAGIAADVRQVREDREAVDRGLRGMSLLSLMGGAISLLAATFIVFGTLSMGVAERGRTLAMLRAVGATRRQVAAGVVGEGVLLAMLGVAIGVPLGLLFILGLTRWFADVFTAGMGVGWVGLVAAVVGMFVAATVASLIPAWNASRVDPLAALRPQAETPRDGPPWRALLAGLALIAVDVLILWPPLGITPIAEFYEKSIRFWAHFVVGLPCLMAGFFLIAPSLVWLAEKLLATPAAVLMRVEPALLRQQLSGGLWRAAGTAAALMVGPAVLIVMNTQGRSGIEGWRLPDDFPDVFLFDRNGIGPDELAAIADAPGVRRRPDGSADIAPIGYLHPRLGGSSMAIAGAAFVPDSTMFVAVEPGRVLSMMDLDFLDGDRETAVRLLERGVRATLDDGIMVDGTTEPAGFLTIGGELLDSSRVAETAERPFIMVTGEFQALQELTVGDPFVLLKPGGSGALGRLSGEPVEFTVAAVVRSPGIDVMVGTFDLGQQFRARSAASVFGTIDDARALFGMQDVLLVAANLEIGVEKEDLIASVAADLGREGIRVSDVRQLKYEIQQGLRNLLVVAGTVAWAALAVASLGVANTVMAGVRARRYQLGVLRAVGVTRGELLRLILAEAALLGLAAAALGVAAGLTMALNARRLQEWTTGYVPELRIAWDAVALSVAVVIAVSLLAALWPATTAARAQVLRLLQAGRAAA